MKWTKEEINKVVSFLKEGKNFREIGEIINRSQESVTRKMHRLGYKATEINYSTPNKGSSKYVDYDWVLIQKRHDDGLSYEELSKEFSLSSHAIIWAKNNGKLKMRTNSEGLKLAWKNGKYRASDKEGVERYRQLCEFKFSVKDYPEEFNLKLIQEHGWYQAANRGNNLDGVSRDHIVSVKFAFENNIDPELIAHPANCRLMRHTKNQKKKSGSDMTLEELKEKIKKWDNKYGK